MINQLDGILGRLLEIAGADAAVVTAHRAGAKATVVASCPPHLVPAGTELPTTATDTDTRTHEIVERDRVRLQTMLAPVLRRALPVRPSGTSRHRLGSDALSLLLIWTSCGAPDRVTAPALRIIDDELADLVQLIETSRFSQSESERLLTVINALDDGVVSVDPHLAQASVNSAAAKLLGLPEGPVPAAEFSAAVQRLNEAAVNSDEVAVATAPQRHDQTANLDYHCRFREAPTHVRVRSTGVHWGAFSGRVWTFADESTLSQALDASERDRALMRASADAMQDPQALIEVVRDPSGAVTDLRCLEANVAACDFLKTDRDQLIGSLILPILPNVSGSGLLASFANCARTGEPVILNDFDFFNEILGTARRYDIRAARVRPGAVSITWRDTSERFEDAQRILLSEKEFRLLAENSGDVVTRFRDGRFIWVSPSIEKTLGGSPQYWIGQPVTAMIPPGGESAQRERLGRLAAGEAIFTRVQLAGPDGVPHWVHLHAKPFYAEDGSPDGVTASIRVIDDEVAAEQATAEAQRLQVQADTRYRRLMDNSSVAMNVCAPDGRFVALNAAMSRFFGYDAESLHTRTWQELTAPEYLDADLDQMRDVLAGKIDSYRMTKQYLHADGRRIWGDLSVSCVRDVAGRVENFIAQIVDVTAERAAEARAEESRRRQAVADARYRRLMDNSPIGMTLITPDGRFDVVNQSLCDFFGYDEATLRTKSWQELTAADYLEADLQLVEDVLAGRIETYRMTKQYIHADGHMIWGDLSVSCLRGETGQVERFISQVTDITAEVEGRNRLAQRDRQNRVLARRLQAQTDRLKVELDSAARYVASILPSDLSGPVRGSSRYLPARELGGDLYHYGWIDRDHLAVYLIDVSGHGIAPALMSISVYNVLRTGSLSKAELLVPERVLTELNTLFPMEQQGGNYLTVWYGIYRRSTGVLRYASAGHPPALLFGAGAAAPIELSTAAFPVGMFADTTFTSRTADIDPGARLLLCSDGAFELPTPAGKRWSWDDFVNLCADQAVAPDWSPDQLVSALRSRTAAGLFEDDCSLVLLSFD